MHVWTYIWLLLGGFLSLLTILAFGYLLAKRRWCVWSGLLVHPVFARAGEWVSKHTPRLWRFLQARIAMRPWHGLALTVSVLLIFLAGYLFALVTEAWTEAEALYAFDQRVYGWLSASTNEQAVALMRFMTHFGDSITVTLVALVLGVVLLTRPARWQALALALAVGGGAGVMKGLKWIFARSRPVDQAIEATGHSFPSGHAFLAATLYGFMIYLVWRFAARDALRIGLTILLGLIILLVGLSRVLLRVHWVSDVMGGFTAGLAWLAAVRRLMQHVGGTVAVDSTPGYGSRFTLVFDAGV